MNDPEDSIDEGQHLVDLTRSVPDTRSMATEVAAQIASDGRLAQEGIEEDPSGPVIFVSYRVHPDQPVAQAVKKLLEAALDPAPRVFVSGLGGLRPSSSTFRQQIQDAVQAARAFLGIITPASRDREWIFFEAGAAFGRNAIYVPLLVESSAEELPSSIADYQACRSADRDDMERTLTSLAEQIGCRLRPQFGKRYGTFRRQLEEHKKVAESSKGTPGSLLERAIDATLAEDGDAESLWIEVEREAGGDPEELVRTRVLQRYFSPKMKPLQVLEEMSRFDAPLKETGQYAYWRGSMEVRPVVAISELRRALQISKDPMLLANATEELARRLASSGHAKDAITLLTAELNSPHSAVADRAVEGLLELTPKANTLGRVLIAIAGITRKATARAYARAYAEAEEIGWDHLRYYISVCWENEDGTGNSVHSKGRSLQSIGLRSLAYRAYKAAAMEGIDVGTLNCATLVHKWGNAAAGLELLDTHSGEFRVNRPSAPHQSRAEMEADVARESEQAETTYASGKLFFMMLAELVERVAATPPMDKGARIRVTVDGNASGLMTIEEGDSAAVRCEPFENIYEYELSSDSKVVLGKDSAGQLVALAFNPSEQARSPSWASAANDPDEPGPG